MKSGYLINHYGVYELRINGDKSFSKWFECIRNANNYAKQNSIIIDGCFEL